MYSLVNTLIHNHPDGFLNLPTYIVSCFIIVGYVCLHI